MTAPPDFRYSRIDLAQSKWHHLSTVGHSSLPGSAAALPLSMDFRTGAWFHDTDQNEVHHYQLNDNPQLYTAAHYLGYLSGGDYFSLDHRAIKFHFLSNVIWTVDGIARHRNRITVLEIGSTLCENYQYLKNYYERLNESLELSYVGLDYDPRVTDLARQIWQGHENCHAVCADGGDLAFLPDCGFDITISNAVPNLTRDPVKCLAEMVRCCRVATVVTIKISLKPGGFGAHDRENSFNYYLPTLSELYQGLSPFKPLYIARLGKVFSSSLPRKGTRERFFIEDLDEGSYCFERLIISKYPILPRLRSLCGDDLI